MFLLGRHATFGQEPPMSSRSITAVPVTSVSHRPGQILPRFAASDYENVVAVWHMSSHDRLRGLALEQVRVLLPNHEHGAVNASYQSTV